MALAGDAREGLADLREALADGADKRRDARAEFLAGSQAGKDKWRQEVDERLTSDEVPVNMARMIHELNNVLPEDAILVADGGFAAHWTGLIYGHQARRARLHSGTGAWRPSATACPAVSARSSPRRIARCSRSPATAA